MSVTAGISVSCNGHPCCAPSAAAACTAPASVADTVDADGVSAAAQGCPEPGPIVQDALEGINGSLLSVRMHPMHLDMAILGLIMQDQVGRVPRQAATPSASLLQHCSACSPCWEQARKAHLVACSQVARYQTRTALLLPVPCSPEDDGREASTTNAPQPAPQARAAGQGAPAPGCRPDAACLAAGSQPRAARSAAAPRSAAACSAAGLRPGAPPAGPEPAHAAGPAPGAPCMAASWQPPANPACLQAALGMASSRLVCNTWPGSLPEAGTDAGVDDSLSPDPCHEFGGPGVPWSGGPAALATSGWQAPSVRAGTPDTGLLPASGPSPSSAPLLHPFLLL